MVALLRLHVLALFVGNALSLNHGNFIGRTNTTDGPSSRIDDWDLIHAFFDQLTPPPTNSPSATPTKTPTITPTRSPNSPTRKPVRAGRFPTTPEPSASRPGRVQGRRNPPTFRPVNSNSPSYSPSHDPTRRPTAAPSVYVPPGVETRIATYEAEWGVDINRCEHVNPNVFFQCYEGGYIGIKKEKNSKCTRVASDRLECTQKNINSDSSISFTCSGIRKVHLMATATVGPSVTDCKDDGNAVKYLTLGRECTGFVDRNPECNGGLPWEQDDVSYCASPVVCSDQEICYDLKLESLTMSNTNKDIRCSQVDPNQDLSKNPFHESYLSSVYVIDWRISGQKRGCLWKSSPLLITCEDGGYLTFEEDYPFCSLAPDGYSGLCQSFAPYSSESEESISLAVKCTGQSESQLQLHVESPSQDFDTECVFQGTIIQSIMISRRCGEKLVNDPSFCSADEQVFTQDENRTHCFVGNECFAYDGCSRLPLPKLSAETGLGHTEQCTIVA